MLAAAVAVAGGVAASVGLWLNRPLTLSAPTVSVEVEPGRSPRQVAQDLIAAGVQTSPMWLQQWFRWSGKSARIRAGNYEFEQGVTPISLLDKLVSGDEVLSRVRFIEGWTFRQVRAELARHTDLKPDTATLDDAAVMAAVGASGLAPEGRFFPDTYTYGRGTSDVKVLRRAYEAMQRQIEAAWAQPRATDAPLRSPDELLTLASIVEKETGRPEDRAQIAGVFLNRLKIGMPLQTDPSVIYGLGAAFDGNLKRVHLQTDGPYNTYTRKGLPPTPIAMPGKAALHAVAQPQATSALYFVARGDGSSEFSTTLADHNRAVQRFQLGGRKP